MLGAKQRFLDLMEVASKAEVLWAGAREKGMGQGQGQGRGEGSAVTGQGQGPA